MQNQNKNQKRVTLLELLLNQNGNEKFIISMDVHEAESMIKFSFANIGYSSGDYFFSLSNDEIISMIRYFKKILILCLKKKLIIDDSIKKSLGYHESQYYKNDQRKNLVYKKSKQGNRYWIGGRYSLFCSAGSIIPSSWLYNDKQGNIVLEISPIYPWIFDRPKPDETFVKYSEWMKHYKPYVVTTIPHEVAKDWVKQIDSLITRVTKSDKKYRCTGPGCVHCQKEGKTGCPCGS